MKVSIPGFVHLRNDQWSKDNDFLWAVCDLSNNPNYLMVCPHALEFELPKGFDTRSIKVERLKEEKRKVMAEFQARVTQIERQISELTCLEMS